MSHWQYTGDFSTWIFREVNSEEVVTMLRKNQEAKAGMVLLRNMEQPSASNINIVQEDIGY